MKNYGLEFKTHREKANYTQSAIARATGISQQKLSYYESGKHIPPINDCETLADFYGITVDELIGREIPKNWTKNTYNNNGIHNGDVNFK